MKSTLLIPCAGKSTRYGNSKPKWMNTHPNGNLMLMESIYGLDLVNASEIIITVVRKHIEDSKINLELIKDKIQIEKNISASFLILDEFTKSQAETIYKTILEKNIKGSIIIKDCDNYFNVQPDYTNSVCVAKLNQDTNAINKSYASMDKFGTLSGIVEKQVIGDTFCVGAYSFSSSEEFCDVFERISNLKGIDEKEIYISHIIQQMLLEGEQFLIKNVSNYCDWGTLEDWKKYTSEYKTIFIDLDGVLVENGSEYFQPQWGNSEGIFKNIETINQLFDKDKCRIIITTARKSIYSQQTTDQLKKLNIKYHQIIFDLPHCKRFLINDYASSNVYPSAVAICLKRNDDSLKDLI